MPREEELSDQVFAYVLGALDAEECANFENRLRDDPELREQVAECRSVVDLMPVATRQVQRRRVLDAMSARSVRPFSPRRLFLSPAFAAIAAVVLLGVGLSMVALQRSAERQISAARARESEFIAAMELVDRDWMVKNDKVSPDHSKESLVFKRTGALEPLMPDGGHKPSDSAIAKAKGGIDDGAPQWAVQPAQSRRFISNEDVVATLENDLVGADPLNRRFMRYFVLTSLYNSGDSKLTTYRVALFKLLNSLSWEQRIIRPMAVDPEETIFRIDLRDYDWDDSTWKMILAGYPYGVKLPGPGYALIQNLSSAEVPFIRADWFLAAASLPPLYHEILDLPDNEKDLESFLQVKTARNIQDSPGRRVWRAGFTESGVSNNNRIVERHQFRNGAYWKSHDFSDNVGFHNIFQHPLDFQRAGGEIIFNLPNGLQAYMLINDKGKRIDQGPTNIVFNKGDQRGTRAEIRNGQSCMACHVNGMRAFTDDVRVTLTWLPEEERDYALTLYTDAATMKSLMLEDQKRFEAAVQQTGVRPGEEPILELSQRYGASLSPQAAAAELGMTTAAFLEQLASNPRLQRLGLATLGAGSGVKRDAWEEVFGQAIQELQQGQYSQAQRVYGERYFNAASSASGSPVITSRPQPSNPGPGPNNRQMNANVMASNNQSVSATVEFVRISPGSFTMGCAVASNTQCYEDEMPAHQVTLTKAYEIGKYEVTQAQWRVVMGTNPSRFKGDYLPVDNVNWSDALEFLKRLNDRKDGYNYRLPTEAEWEYAARAGSTDLMPGDLDASVWHEGNSGGQPHPVGEKQPNAWGLFDMLGNSWEMVQDWMGPYSKQSATDPRGMAAGANRILRSGSWYFPASVARVTYRIKRDPVLRGYNVGFRAVREAVH